MSSFLDEFRDTYLYPAIKQFHPNLTHLKIEQKGEFVFSATITEEGQGQKIWQYDIVVRFTQTPRKPHFVGHFSKDTQSRIYTLFVFI